MYLDINFECILDISFLLFSWRSTFKSFKWANNCQTDSQNISSHIPTTIPHIARDTLKKVCNFFETSRFFKTKCLASIVECRSAYSYPLELSLPVLRQPKFFQVPVQQKRQQGKTCFKSVRKLSGLNSLTSTNISVDCALASRQSKKCLQKHGRFWPNLRHFDLTIDLFLW